MVVLNVYTKSLRNKYKTTLCSKATLFIIVTTILCVVFPFVFVYRSRGFWLKHDTFYEQPDVRMKAQYLFHALTDNLNKPIICNNFPYLQEHTDFDTCNKIKVREIDNNQDGKADELHFNLSLDLPENTKILAINLLLPLDYKLHTVCPLNLQTAVLLQQTLLTSCSELDVLSELTLSQSSPLFCHRRGISINHPFVTDNFDVDSYQIDDIVKEYLKGNITTHLSKVYTTIKTGTHNFVLNLRVKYPIHKVYYKTGFWQIIKWAWIQYFPVYIVFAYIMQKIKSYVFENRLVLCYEECILKKTQ